MWRMLLGGLVVVGVCAAGALSAQAEVQGRQERTSRGADHPSYVGQMQQTSEPTRQWQVRYADQLEALKVSNPEQYQQIQAKLDRQQTIMQIVEEFQTNQIGRATAAKRLRPLVEALSREQLANIDQYIVQMRQQLQELEEAKRHPASLVKRQIKRLLAAPAPRGNP